MCLLNACSLSSVSGNTGFKRTITRSGVYVNIILLDWPSLVNEQISIVSTTGPVSIPRGESKTVPSAIQ